MEIASFFSSVAMNGKWGASRESRNCLDLRRRVPQITIEQQMDGIYIVRTSESQSALARERRCGNTATSSEWNGSTER